MAQDVFGFEVKLGNGFKDPEIGVMIAGSGEMALLQSWSVNYQQQPQPIFECGTSRVYYAVKHGTGSLQASQILASSTSNISSKLGTVCSPETVVVKAATGQCNGSTPVTATLKGSILTGVNLEGSAQNPYVTMSLSATFSNMSFW